MTKSDPVVAENGDVAGIVDSVIRSRRAVRAFRQTPVGRAVVADILSVARCAPSNSNSQPWRVHVLEGEPKRRLSEALIEAHERNELPPSAHFPADLPAECAARQADFGARYYAALGIDRADLPARYRQSGRNLCFFDAPVGLIFTIDSRLTRHSWADYGMFLQNIMIAARARGLDTCPQVSFVRYEPVISQFLGLPATQALVCGMSLGYADVEAEVNDLGMPREAVDDFTVFWR
ncbi:malonic semialdehyde reductase [Variovorax sp. PBS-H4]|uniref:nitroreductase n=1 Tax=Variovorax sp. PBS-H4 TaxID=434008 RepID=UPI00131801C8|nr:nitroreductase [Variovorax sp. PBS-H4]VTU31383.1 malonic semialdehyde reductase [Variovorax sp. PBS-H4]